MHSSSDVQAAGISSEEVPIETKKKTTKWKRLVSFAKENKKALIKAAIFVSIFGIFWIIIGALNKQLVVVFDWIHSIGYLGLFPIFIGFQIASFPVPSVYSLFAILSGYLFNFWIGTAVCEGSAILGAVYVFFLTRHCCRARLEKKIQEKPFFKNMDAIVQQHTFKIVIMLRLSPVPFGVVNVLLATTSIKFWMYLLASFLAMMPEIAILNYVGTTIKTVSEAFSSNSTASPGQIVLLVVQILAAVAAFIAFTLIGRKAFKKAQQYQTEVIQEANKDTEMEAKEECNPMELESARQPSIMNEMTLPGEIRDEAHEVLHVEVMAEPSTSRFNQEDEL